MPLRLVQIVVPAGDPEGLKQCLNGVPVLSRWTAGADGELEIVQILLRGGHSEALVDRFEAHFGSSDVFRVILLAVEGVQPVMEPEELAGAELGAKQGEQEPKVAGGRVSRTELLDEATASSRFSGVYVALVAASSVVAAVGLLRNDLAVIIGAMVIAPLLGPNVALSLATTLLDAKLARQAFMTSLIGLCVALAISVGTGFLVPVDPTIPAIAARTVPGAPDILLALAAGVAGTLAFSSGYPQTVIGVMVAVALLPPLVCFGLLLGSGQPRMATGAFLLLAANVISVNLAGVATFLVRGVTPADWWQAKRARKATFIATGVWLLLLALLGFILYLVRLDGFGPFAR